MTVWTNGKLSWMRRWRKSTETSFKERSSFRNQVSHKRLTLKRSRRAAKARSSV